MLIKDALNLLNLAQGATQKEIKKAYKAASKKYHPDVNSGGEFMMKAINNAFDSLKDYEGEQVEDFTEQNYGEELNAAIQAIIELNLNIEVCGSWVWVTGDTRAVKDTLKGAGYRWANKKKSWNFRPAGWKSKSRGSYSMNKIRNTYGSQKVRNEKETSKIA